MRIASLQPSISITLQHLGRLDSLCACTKYCVDAIPELAGRSIPILADSWTADTGQIVAARPDLVIASVPYRMESLAAILKSGLPVLALAPHSLADIYADMRLIGSLARAAGEADALAARMESAIAAVRCAAPSGVRKPAVYCEEWGKPLIHSQQWVAEMVEAAGGEFVGMPGAHTSAEEVATADPDVLLFAWCGAGDRVPLRRVVEQRGWQNLKSVAARSVYCVPDELFNTPAITLLEGLACITSTLHPDNSPPHPKLIRLPV